MRTNSPVLPLILGFLISACASSGVEKTGLPPQAPAPPVIAPLVQESAAPGSAASSGAPESAVARPVDETPVASLPPKSTHAPIKSDAVWTLKAAKLQGPDQVSPKALGKFTDPKSGAVTTTRCWKYKDFAVTESKTGGEVGAGEVNLRRASAGSKENLCAPEFNGKTDSLNIIEGYYAGRAGDYLVIEGADVGEGLPQFQIFSIATGKEVLKGPHHPREEFTVTQKGKRTSLAFFSKVPVKCELAEEGLECWKKVLAQYPAAKATPMPDCASAFKAAKAATQAGALVTIRAEVADLAAPKVQVTGGKATCQPEKE